MPGENRLEYDLAGDGAHITYTQVTTDDNGPTQSQSLTYQGHDGQGTWSGNVLRFQPSELGTLLTGTLQIIQVAGEEITLTLILPDVEPKLDPTPEPIQTLAIRTRRIDPTIGPPVTGQVQPIRSTIWKGRAHSPRFHKPREWIGAADSRPSHRGCFQNSVSGRGNCWRW